MPPENATSHIIGINIPFYFDCAGVSLRRIDAPAVSFLYLFTGLALALFVAGVAFLVWQVRSGQLDDLDTPALRMLGEDPSAATKPDPTSAPIAAPTPIPPGTHP